MGRVEKRVVPEPPLICLSEEISEQEELVVRTFVMPLLSLSASFRCVECLGEISTMCYCALVWWNYIRLILNPTKVAYITNWLGGLPSGNSSSDRKHL